MKRSLNRAPSACQGTAWAFSSASIEQLEARQLLSAALSGAAAKTPIAHRSVLTAQLRHHVRRVGPPRVGATTAATPTTDAEVLSSSAPPNSAVPTSEPMMSVQPLDDTFPSWLSSDSAATWDAASGTLMVTGPATIIANPGADDPQVNVSGSGAHLTIEPSSDPVVQLGSLTLTNGASAEVTRPNATSFDPSSSLLVVVGTASNSGTLSINSANGSTLGLEDNDLIVRQGSVDESSYLGGITIGSPAVQPAEDQQNVLALAGDDDGSDGEELKGTRANGINLSATPRRECI